MFWRPINLLKTTDGSHNFKKPGPDQIYDDSQLSNFMCFTNSKTQTSKFDDRKYETQTRLSLIKFSVVFRWKSNPYVLDFKGMHQHLYRF